MSEIKGSEILKVHGAGEWSAAYNLKTGELIYVGDDYNVDEKIFALLGVQNDYEQDDAYLMGGNGRSDVAQTLQAMYDWREKRARLIAEADELRAQADELRRQADALEGK